MLGVALGTSGPGATNLITGIADCWFDNVPCLFFTGNVNITESKGDKKIKQQGFQELDVVALVGSITKYAKKIMDVNELLPELNQAIDIARSGRPGPVLLDIPMNIQREFIDEKQLYSLMVSENTYKIGVPVLDGLDGLIDHICKALSEASRPLVLLGGGAVNDDLLPLFIDKLHSLNVFYVASLKGSEKIIKTENYLGMIGAYGTRAANFAVQECDLLIVIGSRLDVRQTGSNYKDFARKATIYQIDIDEHQLNNRVIADKSLHMDCHAFYKKFVLFKFDLFINAEWGELLTNKKHQTQVNEYSEFEFNPFDIFNLINQKFKGVPIQYVCDVGNNQMWAAHSIQLDSHQKIHHSGGLGAMGFSIPTSLGAQLASADPVVCFSGDGGAHLNIQELDIIAREQLPILVIIFNNNSLGMVKNFQDMYFEGRNQSTFWPAYSCDFIKIAEGYNIKSTKIENIDQLSTAIEAFIQNRSPFFLEINIEAVKECRPRLSFGDTLDQQSPHIKPSIKDKEINENCIFWSE